MVKKLLFITLIVILVSSQTTVTPKTQACACSNLLSQADCIAKSGCQWTFSTQTNSSTDITVTSTTQGTCANQTTPVVVATPTTYCKSVSNVTLCAQTIGCAFLNNTCTIFTGCSAYVQTTNAACQAISSQCTTDGTRCVTPGACSTYTTQPLCTGNVASSGAKSCNWTANGASGTCSDKGCSDAPTTYNSQAQCSAWISGCLATGKGCATSLGACSTYTQANGCTGMIGSDGPCTTDTSAGSTVCRPLACSDASTTLSTNQACSGFVSGCLTNGKGCVSSLSACSAYTQTQGCTGLIGSDGPCTTNTTAGSTTCRPLACTDAPSSTNTNAGCSSFLAGCVTTGQGCTSTLGPCSSYTGTTTTCSSYIGSDGNCKGTSATTASCSPRACTDAPTTTNTNAACAAFQTGCVTTGAGCIGSLGLCSSYTGTNTTCSQYLGSDGNCYAPPTQTSAAACAPKLCSDAPNTITTNLGCQAFSQGCVTNGAGCVAQTTCEATALAISCQGNPNCSLSPICLNRSDCANYSNQSLCSQNQQYYVQVGITYLRACTWSSGACSNQVCSALSTSLTTDTACSTALAGCLTNGSGCIDVSADCPSYQGTSTQCAAFKGVNGTNKCGNITEATSTTNCIVKACDNANTGGTIASQADCTSWLTGCNYNGKDNCTVGDCTTYFGTQTFCGAITSATSGGSPQKCWKTADINGSSSACIARTCSQAPTTLTTNSDCNNFLVGCITSGSGCVDASAGCTLQAGTLSQCSALVLGGIACSKTTAFCRPLNCTSKTPPAGTANNKLWCQAFVDSDGNNCQYDAGPSCIAATLGTCSKFVPTSGTNDGVKAFSCYQLNLAGTATCGFAAGGSACSVPNCNQFAIPTTATTADQKLAFCKGVTTDSTSVANTCGLALASSPTCSAKACSDYGIGATDDASCNSYLSGCKYLLGGNCYLQGTSCTSYVIPIAYTTDLQKAQFCATTKVPVNSNLKSCAYIAASSVTNCSEPAQSCSAITIRSQNQLATDNDKLAFCRAQRSVSYPCTYKSSSDTSCQETSSFCSSYTAFGANDYFKFLTCAAQTNDRKPCNFTLGQSICKDPVTTCAQIQLPEATAPLLQSMCALYTVNSTRCGYAYNSSAQTCAAAACSDVDPSSANATSCPAYLSTCVYDGQGCVTQVAACTSYTAQTSGAGALANCQALSDTTGNKCTYSTGSNCQARSCTDTISNPSTANCAAYLSSCQFDGTSCVTSDASCGNYIPRGANDAAKSAICNVMKNSTGSRCTFITGTNCSSTVASCGFYIIPGNLQNAQFGYPACGLIQDQNGNFCTWDSQNIQFCKARACSEASTANSDADCNAWLKGCEQDPTSSCSQALCSNAPTTVTTNTACGTFRKGCLTNGAGCVEPTVACSGYQGTQTQCNDFIGNSIPCTNSAGAAATAACIDRTCALNTTAKSDADCALWLPPTSGVVNCVWGGGSGCVAPQTCALFQGTSDTCPTFTATDGPCHGTGSSPAACVSNNSSCSSAPATYNTDAQCKTWGSACMTTGFGCIQASSATCSSILSPSICPLYKSTSGLYCDLANQCKTKPSACGGFTTATECNNTPIVDATTPTCGWDVSTTACIPLTCAQLPITLTTDSACSAIISTCTTTGAGCVTKGACSTYTRQACGPAATTDAQKVCIWSNSSCRPIQCNDNTTATTDAACNTYLAGCKTTGAGCAATLTCPQFVSAAFCLYDSQNQPCLWYKSSSTAAGTCISYKQCSDVAQTTHSACQAVSPLCTTNGTTCIPITGCSQTVLQASCVLGTDGNCGWLPAAGTTAAACSLFTNCTAASGTTTAICQAWGPTCISNGTTCITKSACSSYTTQTACGNPGTDGACFWVAPTGTATTGTCRLQLCSDATTSLTTHEGCVAFSASTPCTTSGTGCISQATCSSYTVQGGCVQGTDGVCLWATSTSAATNSTTATNTSVCRLKQCTDVSLTTSASCANAITSVKCVSNGVNCIPQSTCSTYTSREACLGGGSDGACAFTPGTNTTTPNVGTCASFTLCSNANQDQTACNSRQDACYFNSTTVNGTTTSSCQPHTCGTKALGSSCQSVPSFDLSTYQICVLTGTTCAAGSPTSLTAATCYSGSAGTYSWSVNSSSCTVCVTPTQNIVNNTVNNSNNMHQYLISLVISIVLLI